MQYICKANFKKGSLEMLKPISKHNITKNIQNNNPLKSYKEKNKHLIMINDSDDDNIDNNIINYWHEEFQLIKIDENNIFNPNGWLNDQHLVVAMQILYVQKLQLLGYQQHTYTIIGTIHRYLTNCLQHTFINNNHWILVKIHASTLNLHCTIYDLNIPTMKKLPNDTIQLLTNIINVKYLLYSYANVMQQPDSSSCKLSTITYATNITFELNLEKSIYNVPQMRSHLHNNINNKTISPFTKYSRSNTLKTNGRSSLVVCSTAEPKLVIMELHWLWELMM